MPLNIPDFSLFFAKKLQSPLKKVTPLFPSNQPSRKGGGGAHYVHTYIHTHTHIHTYIHTYIHINIHNRMYSHNVVCYLLYNM